MGFSEDSVSSLKLRAKEIIVYTSNRCPRCTMLKKWLKNKHADFEEKDLEDIEVMADLLMKNSVVLSAPALEVEGIFYMENQIFDNNGMINPRLFEILKGN